MKTLGIIAEYNPFHNGHRYHLEKSLSLTDADCAIAIMSGNFLQRGHAAMWDKYTRAKMCTSSGIDLAIELPFVYATGSAMDFAMGSISTLNKLGIIDYLCFGAESADMKAFDRISDILASEPDDYKMLLRTFLSEGMSYPMARQNALNNYIGDTTTASITSSPNNILALEYITALKKTNSSIKPIIIERRNAMYHDAILYRSISSATAIRSAIENVELSSELFDILCDDIPDSVLKIIKDSFNQTWPIYTDDLTAFLQHSLLSSKDYSLICDMTNSLANKLTSLPTNMSFTDIANKLCSKDFTSTRIFRCLLHLILNYTNNDRTQFLSDGISYYANILSFKKSSSGIIRELNSCSSIPVITKKADFFNYLAKYPHINSDTASRMWNYDITATNLYNCAIFNRYGIQSTNDYTTILPIT